MHQPDGPVTRAEFRQEIAGLEGRLTEVIRVFMEFQATAGLSERLGMAA
jgi:hypothetical protein